MIRSIYHFLINTKYSLMGDHVRIHRKSIVSPTSKFEGYNSIGMNSIFNGELGYGSYIGNSCRINGYIGRFCSIGDDVQFLTGSHPVGKNFSTSPSFYSPQATKYGNGLSLRVDESVIEHCVSSKDGKSAVYVGNDVWVGSRTTILSGVTIGDGAVIGAGAVVTKDVGCYEIVGGVPAKLIRKRFDDETIDVIARLNIWEKDFEEIKKLAPYMGDVNLLIKEVEDEYEYSNNSGCI